MTTTDSGAALKRTPLHDIHVGLGAKMVPFAGYEMPVQYPSGITTEHKAVRDRAGLFDVSHMGEFIIRGADAIKFVSHVTTNDVAGLAIGQAHYSSILNERGTFEDDCLVYRFDDHLMMVVNASNVVCLTEPRIVDALFDRAGVVLVPSQDEGSPQCRRLRGRGVPFAMLDSDRMAELKDGDQIEIEAELTRIVKS